jgi:hypothetical protein
LSLLIQRLYSLSQWCSPTSVSGLT